MSPRYHLRYRSRLANTLRPSRPRSQARTFVRRRRDVLARAWHHVSLVRPHCSIPKPHAHLRETAVGEDLAQNTTRSPLDCFFRGDPGHHLWWRKRLACAELFRKPEARATFQIMPSFIRPVSLIMFWFHGGSQTSCTSASSTPSMDKILLCASCAIAGPIPQPGAVSVIFTSTLVPPSGFLIKRQSYTRPRSTIFTGISGS